MSEENKHLDPIREAILNAMLHHGVSADEVNEVVKDQIYWIENLLDKKVHNLDTGTVKTMRERIKEPDWPQKGNNQSDDFPGGEMK